jgi:hypothetical protein
MANNLIKYVIREMAWNAKRKTIIQILSSRCRRDGLPELGRFTPGEIQRIISQAFLNAKELMTSFNDLDNIGNYQNEYVGLLDLAIYRALVKVDIAPEYAMKLIGDMMWQVVINSKGLIPIMDPLRKKLIRLTTKDPMTILGKRLKDMMKYPYGEPGYKIEFYKDKNVYCMDIYSCPVYDFYKQFGEEERTLFRKTWCTFDFTAAEHVVDGGKYERKHTLADGDKVCDMRWFIEKGA